MKKTDFLGKLCTERIVDDESTPNIMVFCAHPDDEVLGAGILLSYLNQKIEIVTITDGSPKNLKYALSAGFSSREAYAEARYKEQINAMKNAGLSEIQCHRLNFMDQETSYHMSAITHRIMGMIESKMPGLILTHAYEGGHPDHDSVSFSVWAACNLLLKKGIEPPVVIEFASYHGNGQSEMMCYEFIPYPEIGMWIIALSQNEIELKKRMVDCYKSQSKMLSLFPLQTECFRIMPKYNFRNTPHNGILFYEFFDWGMSAKCWNKLAGETINILGIDDF